MAADSSVFNPGAQHGSVDHKIVAALERLSHVFRGLLWDKANSCSAGYALSPIQIQVLIFLHFHDAGVCRVGTLAHEFGITPATVSDAVRVLKSKGLLTKEPDPGDARVRILRLTDDGRQLTEELADWAAVLRRCVEAYPAAEKAVVMRFLLDVIASLQRAGIVSVARMCATCAFFERDRYDEPGTPHHCRLLNKPLAEQDLRMDCPEHEPVEARS